MSSEVISEKFRNLTEAKNRAYALVGTAAKPGDIITTVQQSENGGSNLRVGYVNGFGFWSNHGKSGAEYRAIRIGWDSSNQSHINVTVGKQSYVLQYVPPRDAVGPLTQMEQFTTNFVKELTKRVNGQQGIVFDAFSQLSTELGPPDRLLSTPAAKKSDQHGVVCETLSQISEHLGHRGGSSTPRLEPLQSPVATSPPPTIDIPELSTALRLFAFTNENQVHFAHNRALLRTTRPQQALPPPTGQPTGSLRATLGDSSSSDPPNLMDLIANSDGSPPTPSSTNVIVVPQTLLNSDSAAKQALFPNVQLLASYSCAAAAALAYKTNPKGFDLSTVDGKFAATNAMANATWETMTKGLSGFYNLSSISSFQHTINNSSTSFHSQFLDTLFKAFAFPTSVMNELDGILTVVNTDLVSFSTSKRSESESLSHMINLTTCEKNSFDVWVAVSHFFLLTIDMASMYSVWKSGKATASSTSYSFKMSYFSANAEMNNTMVTQNATAIAAYVNKMTSNGLKNVDRAVSPKALIDGSR